MSVSVKRLRLYLEGIECPAISANVTAGVGSSATATISVIATPELLNISPRTCVHLFFLEDISVSLENEYSEGIDLAVDKRYRLLFCGEVHRVSYSKSSSSGVTGTLECIDHYENYNRAFVFFADMQTVNATISATNTRYLFSGSLVKENYISFQATETLKEAFEKPSPLTRGYRKLDGLLATMIHIIERFTGFITGPANSPSVQIAGYSMFQTIQQLRLRILQQIGVYSQDTFARKLYDAQYLQQFLENSFKIEGGLLSVNQIIDTILDNVFYQRVPNPCGFPYTSDSYIKNFNIGDRALQEYFYEVIQDLVLDMNTDKLELDQAAYPMIWFGITDAVFTRLKDSLDVSVWARELTNMLLPPVQTKYNLLFSVVKSLSNADRKESERRLKDLSEFLSTVKNRKKTLPLLIEEMKTSDSVLRRLISEIPQQEYSNDVAVSGGKLMNTTMIVPDLFWSVPPTCNVIFPNMYESLALSRDAANETTRYMLLAKNPVTGETGDKLYYAPSAVPVSDVLVTSDGVISQSDVKNFIANVDQQSGKKLAGYLMDHELFTGINTEFDTKNVLSFYNKNLGIALDMDPFFTRCADYGYVRSRLQKTTLNINGIFNPYIAVGFPCVVYDRYSTTDTGSELLGKEVSNHFIGLVSHVSHSIDQSNATTNYSISYVRRHKDNSIVLGGKFGTSFIGTSADTNTPFEGLIEPLWLDRAYRSDLIGEKVYKELLGVGSIVDDPALPKNRVKIDDGATYSALEDAIDDLEKKILISNFEQDGSVAKFSKSFVYREIPTLEFVLNSADPFHSLDINTEFGSQTFNVCPPGFNPSTDGGAHADGSNPLSPGINIEEARKELVRKYVDSIHTRGIPL